MLPATEPGPHRAGLGFVDAVEASFGFLVRDFGLRLVQAEPTFVRYEGDRRFVNVFHGRASYELGVEIGHWVEVDGKRVEERFGLGYAVALSRDPEAVGFRSFTASDAAAVARFVTIRGTRGTAEVLSLFDQPDGDAPTLDPCP